MYEDLKGKVVLITGGATGMGRAAALRFGKEGAKVVVTTGHNTAGGEEVVRLITEAGGEAIFLVCDISKEEDVERTVAAVVEKYGRLDCAFNNAGVGPDGVRLGYGPLIETSVEDWDKVVSVNMRGTFLCLKHEIRQMLKQEEGGAIVNNASIGGLKMAPGFGAYGPSKAGVIAVTRTAAIENAKNKIRVNVVCPGPTTGTELMKNTMATNPEEQHVLEEIVIPMGKLGTAEDIADGVVWLCSNQSKHITGLALSVDGGMHMA